jgi:GntR family transcriptional regulator, transcriptional repressor for pyruvate dehydrogenase complex
MAIIKRRESLTTQVVKAVSDRITGGTYKRGEKLPSEQEFIEEFGISRTVVREAIATLRANGLVTTRQGIGAFVLSDTAIWPFRIDEASLGLVNEIVAVLELRIAIETEAAALTAVRRTKAELDEITKAHDEMRAAIQDGSDSVQADLTFHRAIAQATKNQHFLKIFNYLGEMLIPRTRLKTHLVDASSQQDYLNRVSLEHEQILSAIRNQDPDSARAAMRLHLSNSRNRLLQTQE